MNSAQVHRFGDSVAVYIGDGADLGRIQYFTPTDARKLARAINAAARDIGACKFTSSTCGTFTLQAEDGRNAERERDRKRRRAASRAPADDGEEDGGEPGRYDDNYGEQFAR